MNYRIDDSTRKHMLYVAAVLDVISFFPAANDITLAAAAVIFGIWFKIKGVTLISFKKLLNILLNGVAEFIPFVSVWPGIFVGVIIMINASRAEDAARSGFSPNSQEDASERRETINRPSRTPISRRLPRKEDSNVNRRANRSPVQNENTRSPVQPVRSEKKERRSYKEAA